MTTRYSTAIIACLLASSHVMGAVSLSTGLTTGLQTFDITPAATEWSTLSIAGAAADVTTAAGIDTAVQALAVTGITTALGTQAGTGAIATAQRNSTGNYVFTAPTGNKATILMATLQNDSGAAVDAITITYDYTRTGTAVTEEVMGHRAFFSLTGLANSWTSISALSGISANQTLTSTISLPSAWASGAKFYLLWADDNGSGSPDTAFTIDNFVVIGGNISPTVSLTAPAAGAATAAPGTHVLFATADDADGTISTVEFLRNGIVIATKTSAPYTHSDAGLAAGTYTYSARATDNGGAATTSAAVDVSVVTDPAKTALQFNGTNRYVTMGAATSSLGASNLTIECWFKRTGVGTATSTGSGGVTNAIPLVTKGRGEADGDNRDCNYFFGIDAATNKLCADFEAQAGVSGITGGQNYPVLGNTVIQNDTWYHAAVTYDTSTWTWKLYLDGVLDATFTNPAGAAPRNDSIQHFGIGTALNSSGTAAGYFQGVIDEVRVWNVSRTATEIADSRNSEISFATTGLLARYGLNEGGGIVANNTVGVAGAPIGTLTNSPLWVDGAPFAAAPVGIAPTVALTAPLASDSSVPPATINITANAADSDGSITKVEFYQGATKLGEDLLAPYTFDWTTVPSGTYSVTARATDNDGNVTVSAPRTLYVNALPGSGSLTRGPYLQKAAPTTMTVRWRSSQPIAGRVRFGLIPANLTTAVDEAGATTEHEITLTGLAAGTTYFYSVGSSTDTLAGGDATCTFTSPPISGTAVNTRVWVLGDAGTGTTGQTSVRDAFYTWTGSRTPDMVLQLGDNAYNDGLDSEFQTKVFDIYAPLMRKSPFWSCLGNHETNQATSYVDTYPYFSIYTFPKAGECGGVASGTEHYYSWDYGNIHFISLDSMTASRSASGAMATWLTNDLASTTLTWIIAIWHHPPYTKGSHNSDSLTDSAGAMVEMRQNILPILEAGGVDLVLCGHSHCYERSYLLDGHYGLSTSLTAAMKKNAGDGRPAGTGAYGKPLTGSHSHFGAVYCVTGSAGKATGGSLNHPAHYISLNNLGSTVLDINGTTLNATFLRETGAVADSFSIVKQGGSTAPLAVTLSADSVSSTSATLRGSVNPTGTVSTANFQHGLTAGYGTTTTLALSPSDGLASQSVGTPLTGLSPGTTYHFRVSATNAWGTTDGADLTFTTQTSFEEWIAGKGVSGPDSLPMADADRDGNANFLEWAFGTHPAVSDAGQLKLVGATLATRGGPVVQINGADVSAVFCRRKDFATTGLTYATQFSADLIAWVTVAGSPVPVADDGEIEALSILFPALVNGSKPQFFRLMISAP